MLPLSARPANSGTKTCSCTAPDFLSFSSFFFFLEYRLMRTGGRKMPMDLWLAKALMCSGEARRCRHRMGTLAPREEMESALVRVLPASLHTFLFQICGWLCEQAAQTGEESHEMQGMTWSLVCLLESRTERQNHSAVTQQRAQSPHLPLPASPNCLGKLLSLLRSYPAMEHGGSSCSRTPQKPHSGEPLSMLAVPSLPTALPVWLSKMLHDLNKWL